MTIPSALEIFFPIRSNVPLRQKKSSSFAFTCLEQHFIWLWKLFRCAGGGFQTPSQVVLTMWNEIARKASWISFRMKFLSLIITFSSVFFNYLSCNGFVTHEAQRLLFCWYPQWICAVQLGALLCWKPNTTLKAPSVKPSLPEVKVPTCVSPGEFCPIGF